MVKARASEVLDKLYCISQVSAKLVLGTVPVPRHRPYVKSAAGGQCKAGEKLVKLR